MEPSATTGNPPLQDGQPTTHVLETPHIPDEATADLAQFNQFPQTIPPNPIIFHGVATTLRTRFKSSHNVRLFDCAIIAYDRAVDLTPPEDPAYISRVCDATAAFIFPLVYDGRPFSLLRRSRLESCKSDILRRVVVMRGLIASVRDEGHPLEGTMHECLANLYHATFDLSEDIDDLSQCISLHEQAISLFQLRGGEKHRTSVSLLSRCLDQRFRLTGDVNDYTTAIKYQEELLKELLPVEEKHRATILQAQSSTFLSLLKATGHLEHVDAAITHQRQALDLMPQDGRYMYCNDAYALALSTLSGLICLRGSRTRSFVDVDEAVAGMKKAQKLATLPEIQLQLLPPLADILATRGSLTGDVRDTSEAITVQQQAISSITPDNPSRSLYIFALALLATFFLTRYNQTNAIADLSYAISAYEEAIKYDQDNAYNLDGLPGLLLLRIARNNRKSQPDLDNAISALQKSINAIGTPQGYPQLRLLTKRLDSLSFALSLRFLQSRDAEDVNNAICLNERAISHTPKNNARYANRILTLSFRLTGRFDLDFPGVGGDLQDLERAITLAREALATPNLHHPVEMQAKIKTHIATLLARRHTASAPNGNPQDIQQALRQFFENATDPTIDPISRNLNAGLLVKWAPDSKQTLQACALAVSLYSEYVDLGRTTEERYGVLETAFLVVARGAVGYALKYGKTDLAVDWMEQSRCLVWMQMDSFHSPPSDLSVTHPELARQYMSVGTELKIIGSRSRKMPTDGESVVDVLKDPETVQEIRRHMELAKKWQDILARIRETEGYSSVLRPMTTEQYLENAPKEGAVVILTAEEDHADAVALVAGRDFIHIPLRAVDERRVKEMVEVVRACLTRNEIRTREDRRGLRFELGEGDKVGLREILADLWQKVVVPILLALEYSPVEDPESRPRIWWCPAGSFEFLPIHAAGLYGEDSDAACGSCVMDYAISSYTPNITMLLKRRAMPAVTTPNSLLLVSQPETPNLPPIPGTQQEAKQLESAMGTAGIPVQSFTDDQATIETINKGLPECTWAHFACHAAQDHTAPLKSGFYLHDGRLELASITHHLPNAEHAFLSACQTGTGDDVLKEEAVHIAAAMLAAGYRGVVATMWSISDAYGPIAAREFYQYLLERAADSDVNRGVGVTQDVLEVPGEEIRPKLERAEGEGSGSPALKRMDCTLSARALHAAICKLRSQVGDGENGLLTWVPYVHFGV